MTRAMPSTAAQHRLAAWLVDLRTQGRQMWHYGVDLFKRNYLAIEPGVAFGAGIAAIGFPVYFFMWQYLFPQPYENLTLRLLAGLFCVGLWVKNYWPAVLKPYAPLYFFITVTYCLPFFFGFMMLQSGFSPIWMLSELTALFVLVFLLDWISLLLSFVIGSLAAWLFCTMLGGPVVEALDYVEFLPVFVFVLLCGIIFNFRSERSQLERARAMDQLGETISQSLSTPLNSARAAAQGLSETLPGTLKDLRASVDENAQPVLSDGTDSLQQRALKQLDAAAAAATRVDTEIRNAQTLVELFAVRGFGGAHFQEIPQRLSMRTCVKQTLAAFPYRSARQPAKILFPGTEDFYFRAPEKLMQFALMALIDNALKSIDRKGGGEVSIIIAAPADDSHGVVTVSDQGVGIPAHVMPRIFDRFYSYKGGRGAVGTGLSFVKTVTDMIDAEITLHSEEGVGTTVKIVLPVVKQDDAPVPSSGSQ